MARLQHYVTKHQADWDQYVPLLMYALKAQVHRSTCTTPSTLVLSCQPPGPATLHPANAIPDDMTERLKPISFRIRFLHQVDVLCKRTGARLKIAQACYKRTFDRTVRCTMRFSSGQHFFFDRRPIQMIESGRIAKVF